jgi:hypothetical protein
VTVGAASTIDTTIRSEADRAARDGPFTMLSKSRSDSSRAARSSWGQCGVVRNLVEGVKRGVRSGSSGAAMTLRGGDVARHAATRHVFPGTARVLAVQLPLRHAPGRSHDHCFLRQRAPSPLSYGRLLASRPMTHVRASGPVVERSTTAWTGHHCVDDAVDVSARQTPVQHAMGRSTHVAKVTVAGSSFVVPLHERARQRPFRGL